jgi:signal transduction histidine kinase
VVWNLATNGLRAMPDGGRLVLRARLEGGDQSGPGMVSLEAEDEGIGIPPEQLDKLFQPFHGSFARGSGLGLAIVHRIVSDHHGEIRVRSEVGKGTRVVVRLKAREEAGSRQLAAGSAA